MCTCTCILGCMRELCLAWWGMWCSFSSPFLETPPEELHPVLRFQHMKDMNSLEYIQRMATGMINTFPVKSDWERPGSVQPGLQKTEDTSTFLLLGQNPTFRDLSFLKKHCRSDIDTIWYLKRTFKKLEGDLFTRTCNDGTKGHSFKLKESRFRLDTRNNFF